MTTNDDASHFPIKLLCTNNFINFFFAKDTIIACAYKTKIVYASNLNMASISKWNRNVYCICLYVYMFR